ncbi:MAG TPA: type II toxin-antitoxin system prevent-host-death family antitoxin [Anaerolineaceae bacterium]|nr:type II toxin-antitoxin system prevent-host-death family antitoxin [Anaerolineaceae bacterium]
MDIQMTYSQARARLAELMDRAVNDKIPVFITRKNGKRVTMIDAEEYESLIETVYLLSSPANARRLLEAIQQADRGEGQKMSIEELRRTVGLDENKA